MLEPQHKFVDLIEKQVIDLGRKRDRGAIGFFLQATPRKI
jgi:hypothetical protein